MQGSALEGLVTQPYLFCVPIKFRIKQNLYRTNFWNWVDRY